jgi:hypothetical protein
MPQLFSQPELNDLICPLNLPKNAAEALGSRLKVKNLFPPKANFSWYRHRERDLTSYFSEDGSMVYCKDISGLISCFGVHYDTSDWRLFTDSSLSSLKDVLLHNGNVFAPIPVAHSIHLKKTYDSLKRLLNSVNYKAHGLLVCGDFRVIALLLGLQVGYITMPCFLCKRDSWAKSEQIFDSRVNKYNTRTTGRPR